MVPSKWQRHKQLWQATLQFSCPDAVLTWSLHRKKQRGHFLGLQNWLWMEISFQLPKTLSLPLWRMKHCPLLPMRKMLLVSAWSKISRMSCCSLEAQSPGCCHASGAAGCCWRCARWNRWPRAAAQRTPGWMHKGGSTSCRRTQRGTAPPAPCCSRPHTPTRGLLGSRGGRQRPRWPPSWQQGWTLFPAALCKIPVKEKKKTIVAVEANIWTNRIRQR